MQEVEKSYEAGIRLSIVKDKIYPKDSVLQTLDVIEGQIRSDVRLDDVQRDRLVEKVEYWRRVVGAE